MALRSVSSGLLAGLGRLQKNAAVLSQLRTFAAEPAPAVDPNSGVVAQVRPDACALLSLLLQKLRLEALVWLERAVLMLDRHAAGVRCHPSPPLHPAAAFPSWERKH